MLIEALIITIYIIGFIATFIFTTKFWWEPTRQYQTSDTCNTLEILLISILWFTTMPVFALVEIIYFIKNKYKKPTLRYKLESLMRKIKNDS